jgi:hypothetical protein
VARTYRLNGAFDFVLTTQVIFKYLRHCVEACRLPPAAHG